MRKLTTKAGKFNEDRNNLLIELKCFLQKPMESNFSMLVEEMQELVQGPKETEYYDSTPDIEKASSLEDLFNDFT